MFIFYTLSDVSCLYVLLINLVIFISREERVNIHTSSYPSSKSCMLCVYSPVKSKVHLFNQAEMSRSDISAFQLLDLFISVVLRVPPRTYEVLLRMQGQGGWGALSHLEYFFFTH
jgi:hypothetical protein